MIRRRRIQAAAPTATGPTAVFIACHELVIAVATDAIDRLHVASELESRPHGDDGMHIVSAPGGALAGWDLGTIVGGRELHDTWMIVKTGSGGPSRRFALRAGRCLAVRALPPTQPLARPLFDGSDGAATGEAFATRDLAGIEAWACGLVLAPHELLDAHRRARCEALAAERVIEW